MGSRSLSKKKDMLKISHRSPNRKRQDIKGSLTMKKKRHASKRKVTKAKPKTRTAPKRDKHQVKRPKKSKPSTGKTGYLIKGDRVHYRTRAGVVGSMPKHHVGMVRSWKLSKVNSL